MIEYFPDPYPEEIFYSTCARYCDTVQFNKKRHVFRELFGNHVASPIIDLPCHLGYLVDHLPIGHMYTVDKFIQSHTLFPFYAAFLFDAQREAIRTQMIIGNGSSVHYKAGVPANSVRRPSWLRYCPECLQKDKERFGESYWHRLHQVPGVEICPVHMVFLENSPFPVTGLLRKRRFITAEALYTFHISRTAKNSPYFSTLLHIAQDVYFLLNNSDQLFDTYTLAERYASLLSAKGLLTKGGSVHKLDLMEAFITHYDSELLALLHCEVGTIRDVRKNWPAGLVTPKRNRQHPLKHILAIRFLNSTSEIFFTQHPQKEIEPSPPFGDGPWPCLNPACEYYQQKHILTYDKWKYVNKKHIDKCKGKFACSCGFVYVRLGPDHSAGDIFRKDKIISYGPIWEKKLGELWFDPLLSLRSIARQLGINIVRINKQAIKLGLPVPRPSIYHIKIGESRRRFTKGDLLSYREQWLTLIEEASERGVSSPRKQASQIYEWLLRYDREWLAEHQPERKFRSRSPMHEQLFSGAKELYKGDKEHRDVITSKAIKETSNLLRLQEPPQRVTLKEIIIHVPQVLSLKNKPVKAPLTIQALKEVVETTEDFAIRRIQWAMQKYQEEGVFPTRAAFVYRLRLHYFIKRFPKIQEALDEAMAVLSNE